MEITDSQGRELIEVTVKLTRSEVTDLLVAASQIDDGTTGHGMVRDRSGNTLAIYGENHDNDPLERGTDWWVGPLILITALLVLVGAFTVAKGLVTLLF